MDGSDDDPRLIRYVIFAILRATRLVGSRELFNKPNLIYIVILEIPIRI